MNPVREDAATITCAICGTVFVPQGRQRFCTTLCRQAAWRRRRAAPVEPVVAKAGTVYESGSCGRRFLGAQRLRVALGRRARLERSQVTAATDGATA